VSRRQQGRWAAKDQQAQDQQAPQQQAYDAPPEQAPPAAEPPADDDMDSKLAQLKELGALKEQGVLTDAEFAVQKDKILHP
jgi:hypothetical protein